MKDKIRIAAVGLGWVTQNRHLPAILSNSNYELVGVIDSKEDRARDVAKRYGVLHAAVSDLENVEWLRNLDAISIGAPPADHARLISAGLRQGKHVLTEKPFVLDINDGPKVIELAGQQQRVLSVVHNFQFSRSFLKLQADIARGRFGAVKNVWAMQLSNPRRRLPVWYEQLPGGLYFDESPHLLYLIRRLIPGLQLQAARVTPSSRGESTPAEVYAQFDNPAGQRATMLLNFESSLSEWHVVITGEKGTADVDVFRDIYVFLPDDGQHGPRDILRTGLGSVVGHLWGTMTSGWRHLTSRLDYGNREVFSRFAAAIRSNELQPEFIGSTEALAVRKLQQQIIEGGD